MTRIGRIGARRCLGVLAWALGVALATPAFAGADPLALGRSALAGGGGGFGVAGSFVLAGTIGQPAAGPLIDRTYTILSGFWAGGPVAPVDVEDGPDGKPNTPYVLRVFPAAPNPLVQGTTLSFELPDARDVDVRVFDVTGALVRVLRNGAGTPGRTAIVWDATDAQGRRVNAGLYWVRMRLGDVQRSQKLAVLR